MLRAKIVSKVLSEITTDGVQSALLMTVDGSLLATTADAEGMQQEAITGAIMANIFGEYQKAANAEAGDGAGGTAAAGAGGGAGAGAGAAADVGAIGLTLDNPLQFLLFDFEGGKVAVVSVDKYLLCAYADASVDFGMLKKKLEVTRDYLEEPLSRIEDDDDTTGTL